MKNILFELLIYVSNHIVNKIPIHRAGRWFYRYACSIRIRVRMSLELGIRVTTKAVVSIGDHSTINRDCVLDGRGELVIGDNVKFLMPLMYRQKYVPGVAMAEVLGSAASVGYAILTNYISTRGKFYFTTIAEATGLLCGFCVTIPLLHFIGA